MGSSIVETMKMSMKVKRRKVKKGEIMLLEGDISKKIGLIESGLFRAYLFDRDQNEITTNFYERGEFATDFTTYFNQTPSIETVVAVIDSVVWEMSHADT